MVFQCRIMRPRILFTSSRLANSPSSDKSPPKTSRLYSLGITASGPAISAAKNPSSSSTFTALPALTAFEAVAEAVEFVVRQLNTRLKITPLSSDWLSRTSIVLAEKQQFFFGQLRTKYISASVRSPEFLLGPSRSLSESDIFTGGGLHGALRSAICY
jgi:hypothetical protein